MDNKIYSLADNYSLYQGDFKTKKLFLFDIIEGSIYRLNEVSYDMLSYFNGENDFSQILNELNKDYDVECSCLETDLKIMLRKWIDKGILVEK